MDLLVTLVVGAATSGSYYCRSAAAIDSLENTVQSQTFSLRFL